MPYSQVRKDYDEFNSDDWKWLLVLAVILGVIIIKCR